MVSYKIRPHLEVKLPCQSMEMCFDTSNMLGTQKRRSFGGGCLRLLILGTHSVMNAWRRRGAGIGNSASRLAGYNSPFSGPEFRLPRFCYLPGHSPSANAPSLRTVLSNAFMARVLLVRVHS